MIIEHLESMYRAEAEKANTQFHNPFRASRAGHCIKAMAYDKLGIKGDPVTPRRSAVFKHGHLIDSALKHDLKNALGDTFLNLDGLGKYVCEIEGVEISFTPDGAFQTDKGDIGIVEIKTMSDYGFDRALKGEIERTYLCQAWTYQYGTSFNPIVFICYRKQTSHFVEVVFDREATGVIVTQRFGGDPLQLATDDPLLIAEIKSPFDPSVEQEVREKFRTLAAVKTEDDLPPGVMAIEPETLKVQGKEKAAELAKVYGVGEQKGSWWTFQTGRQIAGFPCNYCSHIKGCLGAKLEIKDGRPIWVIQNFPN